MPAAKMKKILKNHKPVLFLALILCLGFSGRLVHADTTNTVLSTLITPSSPEDSTTIDQRIAQRKTTYKAQLVAVNAAQVASKCSLAQSVLTEVRSKDSKTASIRLQAYNDLAKRLAFLVDNLSSQGTDATALSNAQTQFIASINTYLNDREKYKVAMDDAIVIDCNADPVGFRASVLDAQKLRATLIPDVAAIKNDQAAMRTALSNERKLLISSSSKKAN